MPTELEFQNTSTEVYGTGTAGLLFSSSADQGYVTGSVTPTSSSVEPNGDILYFAPGEDFGPYSIIGLTVPNTSKENVDVLATLRGATGVQFTIEGREVNAEISNRVVRKDYIYLRLEGAPTVDKLPSVSNERRLTSDSRFIFTPYATENFDNSQFNPLISNASTNVKDPYIQVVDEATDQAIPVNIEAIKLLSAVPAQVAESNYTVTGIVNSRYDGSSLDNGGRPGDEPFLGLRTFRGSLHLLDSTNTTISSIQLSDRTLTDIFFEPLLSGSGNNQVLNTFPVSGSILYTIQNSSISRIASSKVFSIDEGTILSTNELGRVTSVV